MQQLSQLLLPLQQPTSFLAAMKMSDRTQKKTNGDDNVNFEMKESKMAALEKFLRK